MKGTQQYYQNNAIALCAAYEAAQLSDLHIMLLSMFHKQERVLELGVGSGRDGALLVSYGYDWKGIEGAQAMVNRALVLHPELEGRILCQDMQLPLPFPDASFGGAFSFAALMHLEAPEVYPVLRETRRVLSPDRPFLVSVPLARADVNEKGFDQEGRYFLPWSKDEWCNAFSEAGFKVNECKITNDSLGRQITWLNLATLKCAQTTAP